MILKNLSNLDWRLGGNTLTPNIIVEAANTPMDIKPSLNSQQMQKNSYACHIINSVR